jgi:hypothetical protein
MTAIEIENTLYTHCSAKDCHCSLVLPCVVALANLEAAIFHRNERIPDPVKPRPSWPSFFFFCRGISHIRQNLRFSSPAPVHTMSPPGLIQLNNTRESCASLISATRSSDGYACTMIAFVGYPCVVRNSFLCGDH